jgi:DNA-binding transcriptional LysR family regulator
MQIERHEIRVLSAVIEEGGFSRAAERLNVSQSAVSQAIASLEHKLVWRCWCATRAAPTEAGLRLFRLHGP